MSEARATQVLRLFRHTGTDLLFRRRSWWESGRGADASFLVGMLATFLLAFIEIPLWQRRPLPVPFGFRISALAAALAVAAALSSGCLVDRVLAHWTDQRLVISRGWLLLRFILASSPLLTFYTPALWRGFVARRAAAGLLEARVRLDLTSGRDLSPRRATRQRRLLAGLIPFLWIVIGFGGPFVGAIWLGTEAALDPRWRNKALGVCIVLHLGASLAMGHYLRDRRQTSQAVSWRAAALRGLPLLWLLGLPGLALGVFLLPLVDSSRDRTLVTAVHWRRWNASRLALWADLERSLARRWQTIPWWRRALRPRDLERPAKAGRAEKGLLALYRWKSLLSFFDGVTLAGVFSAWGRRPPSSLPATRAILVSIEWGAAALASLGLILQLVLFVARLLRATDLIEKLDRHPYGRALLSPYAALLNGLFAGQLLFQGQDKELCLWLALTGGLVVIFGVLAMLSALSLPGGRTIRQEASDAVLLPVLLLGLLGVEVVLLKTGGTARVAEGLRACAVLSPLWAALSGLTLGKWLLRPYSWADLRAPDRPLRTRAILAFLAVTVLLPLGGLLMPLWVLARRCWATIDEA